ncbi:MAG: hypothetical protein K0R57_986 [Paenibacillaceae bacterium]|nr:hypothetical protein [Paenibacillaceae bacterium]
MPESPYTPLSFGQLLDRSLRLYRNHFVKFALLALILFGPFYLLYGWIFSDAFATSLDFSAFYEEEWLSTGVIGDDTAYNGGIGGLLFFFLVLAPLFVHVILPVAFSAGTLMVQAIYNREEPDIKTALKRTMQRFGTLFGHSLIYFLMMAGIYIALTVAIIIAVFLVSLLIGVGMGIGGSSALGAGPGMIFLIVVVYLAVSLLIYALFGYFLIRFGYYIPGTVNRVPGMGFARSWTLTKGSFWRIFFVYLVLTVMMSSVYGVSALLIQFALPVLFLKVLIPVLMIILLMPLVFIVYAVCYFDLLIWREGLDIGRMLHVLRGTDGRKGLLADGPGDIQHDE